VLLGLISDDASSGPCAERGIANFDETRARGTIAGKDRHARNDDQDELG
jgi:hypothetical protein